jgi:hypothetical protein
MRTVLKFSGKVWRFLRGGSVPPDFSGGKAVSSGVLTAVSRVGLMFVVLALILFLLRLCFMISNVLEKQGWGTKGWLHSWDWLKEVPSPIIFFALIPVAGAGIFFAAASLIFSYSEVESKLRKLLVLLLLHWMCVWLFLTIIGVIPAVVGLVFAAACGITVGAFRLWYRHLQECREAERRAICEQERAERQSGQKPNLLEQYQAIENWPDGPSE